MAGTHSGLGGRGGGVCLVVLGGGDLERQAPLRSVQPGWSTNRDGGGWGGSREWYGGGGRTQRAWQVECGGQQLRSMQPVKGQLLNPSTPFKIKGASWTLTNNQWGFLREH